ncbi:MAG TPA: helix-turn-helix transcriptional regulator [Blastocatellia bacterium]|nr:helix-turn-helix transcriptional regulator [Blastocatellia bacterium]
MNGREIRTRRLKLGMTQAELGQALGVSGNAVALWEREERSPEAPLMLEMALDYLLTQQLLNREGRKRLKALQQTRAELEALLKEPLTEERPRQRVRRKER